MKRKKMSFFIILFLLLSALAITVVAKAFCDPHAPERPIEAVPVLVTMIPEDKDGAAAIVQTMEELAVAETQPSEQAELTLRQEEPSCNLQAVESTENKELSIENTEESPKDAIIAPASMENALFIGDSRTVGLAEYAQMDDAHFFAAVGMTVYGVDTANVSVPMSERWPCLNC